MASIALAYSSKKLKPCLHDLVDVNVDSIKQQAYDQQYSVIGEEFYLLVTTILNVQSRREWKTEKILCLRSSKPVGPGEFWYSCQVGYYGIEFKTSAEV